MNSAWCVLDLKRKKKGKKSARLHKKKQPGVYKEKATNVMDVPMHVCQHVSLFLPLVELTFQL